MLNHRPSAVGFTLLLVACSGGSDGADMASAAGSGALAGSAGVAGVNTGGAGASSAGSGGSAPGGASNLGGNVGAAGAFATAGAASGAAGGGGTGGGSRGPVKPTLRNGKWAFDMGDVTLEVDPQTGGRITTFALGGVNVLTDPTVNPTYWGSTLWISPEAALWQQPPPAPIDSDPYVAVATDTSVTLTGMPYASAKLSASAVKTISADPTLGAFRLQYQVTNNAPTAVSLAPWEVTRVFPRGLTFFPTGPSMSLSMGATLPTTNAGGLTWFAYDASAATANSKLYADGAEGWVAHVADGLVFIKSFADLSADKIAPKEGDVELFTTTATPAMGQPYVELENQGAYGPVAPGASTSWSVTWFLRKLPLDLQPSVGNAALAAFVRDTIAGK